MTKRDVLSVSFKILGVICIMYTIVLIPNIGWMIGMQYPQDSDYARYVMRWQIFSTILFPTVTFLFGFLLLKWGEGIAVRLVREDSPIETTRTDDWERRLFSLSMKIIGLIWLIRGIPDLIKAIGELTMRWYLYYYSIPHMIGVALGAFLSLLIGFYLLVDGRYFTKLAFGRELDKTR